MSAGTGVGTARGTRFLVAILLALTGWLLWSAVSADSASAAAWRCRASVASVRVANIAKVEPIVANSAEGRRCYPDASGLRDIELGAESNDTGGLQIRAATARTDVKPALALLRNQVAGAEATGASVHIEDPTGKILIGVDGIRSVQSARCVDGRFQATGSTDVATVTLNGQRIPLAGVFKLVGDGLNGLPTGQILKIHFDEVQRQGDATTADQLITRRAVHVEILRRSDGRALFEVALGETKIGRSGNPCVDPPGTEPRWACRASAARLSVSTLLRLEPIVANSAPQAHCQPDASGVNTITLGSPSVGGIQAEAASAQTTLEPLVGLTRFQEAGADTEVAEVRLASADGSFVLEADVITSTARARCVGGVPVFAGDSNVLNVTVNGQSISPDRVFEEIGNGVNGTPLGQIVHVTFNEETVEHPSLNSELHHFRAIHAEVLRSEDRAPLLDAVVAETTVGARGDVC